MLTARKAYLKTLTQIPTPTPIGRRRRGGITEGNQATMAVYASRIDIDSILWYVVGIVGSEWRHCKFERGEEPSSRALSTI
jgi:hypothetical protein